MKRIFVTILSIFIILNPLSASDVVVNVVPNPVQLNDSARISLVSEFEIKKAILVLGDQELQLKSITSKLHRINIVTTEKMMNQDAILKIYKSEKSFFKLPVGLQIISNDKENQAYSVLDSNQVSLLEIDNSQIEIDRLQDKVDLLDQKNQKLEDRIDKLKNQIKNQDDLDLSRKEIKEREQQLKLLEEKLNTQEKQRQTSIAELNSKISEFESLKEGLEKKESILNEMESQLSEKSTQLTTEEMRLAGEKVVIKEKSLLLQKKQTDIQNKSIALSQLKTEVSKQQKELKKRTVDIKIKKRKIDDKEKTLNKRETELVNEKNKLTEMSTTISKKRKNLIALNLNLDSKRKEIADEKKRFYLDKKKKERVISQQQEYVKSLEQKMVESLNSLSDLEKEHLRQQEAVMLESKKVETEKDLLENEKLAFSYEKKAIKELELELAVRIEMMKKLGVYIDSKLSELQQQFLNNKDYQDRYESDLGKKVDHIDNLTRLIEKRASRMEHLNYKLMAKNKQLKTDLRNTLIPDYRFAFSPYIGLRVNKANQEIYDSREVGVRLLAFTGVHFHFASGIGLYNYIQRDSSGQTKSGRSTTFSFDMGYLFNPMEKIGIYLSSGVTGDFYSSSLPTNVSAALDFKYKAKPNINTFLGVSVADSAMVRMGVETHLVSTKKIVAYSPHGSEGNNKNIETIDQESAFVTLNDIPVRYIFHNKPILFTDIKKGWYSKSVKNMNHIGIYSSNNFDNQFEPNSNLNYENASMLLSWMYDIESLLLVEPIDISFSIFSDINETVLASVYIKDEDGKTIEVLCDKRKFYVGEQRIKWDPSKSQKQLKPGGYYVYLDIYSSEIHRDKKEYSLESTLISSVVKPFEIKGVTSYQEFLTIKTGKKMKSFKQKAVQNNWLQLNKNQSVDTITRIDFIVAISKLLVESGALYRPINVDFTPYKDWSLVPLDKKRYLTTYVLELGYGGDSLSKLNPNDLITNAQAAVILDRFFKWKKQKITKEDRHFNVKSIALKP